MRFGSLQLAFLLSILLTVADASAASTAQTAETNYHIYDSAGKPRTLQDIVEGMGTAEVIFIGELHDDPTAHQIEAELLQKAYERYGRGTESTNGRSFILSLEMFERDVQVVLNEYLSGLILERQFLSSSRPWNNYQSDYRPLIEFAREHKLPVLAANAPERYVNRVSRLGPDSLDTLSPVAKAWLSPLPYGAASPAYAAKFKQLIGNVPSAHGGHGGAHLLEAQVLRDATMGYALAEQLKQLPKALVMHVNGSFHSEGRRGTPEQLLLYRPQTRMKVVTIIAERAPAQLNAEFLGQLGDFVIFTDSTPSRSF